MSDRQWKFIEYFSLISIFVIAITLTFLSESGIKDLHQIHPLIKWPTIIYILVAIFFVVLTEVRKRTKEVHFREIGITAFILIIAFMFFLLIR